MSCGGGKIPLLATVAGYTILSQFRLSFLIRPSISLCQPTIINARHVDMRLKRSSP